MIFWQNHEQILLEHDFAITAIDRPGVAHW
jgi:hypothetical protein